MDWADKSIDKHEREPEDDDMALSEVSTLANLVRLHGFSM
jgi:hypothetical protein